jgi:hypothetical protein
MSDTKEPTVRKDETPSPAADPAENAENKREDNEFHPHKRHEHAVIKPPQTGVTHLDPGAIVFS